MKKYVKPMVQIVNIKSSEDIAATNYSTVKQKIIQNYLLGDGTTKYAITQYSAATSVNPVES